MTIYIHENAELQVARRAILCSHILLVLLLGATALGAIAFLQKSVTPDFKALSPSAVGFYFLVWLAMFACQIFGYYKLAKVGRNLLIFRCIAFPYIADALLSLFLLLVMPQASITQLFNFKIITFFLYAYYSYKLFYELSRVTDERFFRQGILLLGFCLTLLLFIVGISRGALILFSLLFLVGMLVGWGMIFMGFFRLKQINTP
ncbi:phosphatidylglycerophosphate synthase [Helicobacter ailurogastricus]|uniref:phosphatidylglycerophosphate synthase n=1 Tax=Helicobacter ailurogastricus TaxID=1578720 RepID=UPI000CF02BC8|nr:phosphatidylglycerophosphate synthase [Helicobacter ailurogastricus]